MATQPRKPRRSSIPLADLVAPALGAALARRGFGEADLIVHWEDIVGARLAAASEPVKLQWPVRARLAEDAAAQAAVLVVRVEGAFAVELQHLAPLVIERVNSHLGWRCVARLALRQAPLERRQPSARRRAPPTPAVCAAARRAVEGIENRDLRDAIERLAAGVLSDLQR